MMTLTIQRVWLALQVQWSLRKSQLNKS